VAYTTGYGAVMPAYAQPMMSVGGQIPHDEVTNESSGHADACGDEYVTGADTDYTAAVAATDDYCSTTNAFVSDTTGAESAVDAEFDEELADKLVR